MDILPNKFKTFGSFVLNGEIGDVFYSWRSGCIYTIESDDYIRRAFVGVTQAGGGKE